MLMRLTFVETPLFASTAKRVIAESELIAMQEELLRNPYAGDLVAGTGGARKIRVATSGSGKRGGARVMYRYSQRVAKVYLLLAYAKNETGTLSPAGRRHIRMMVETLDREI